MRSASTSGISAAFAALFPTSGQVAYVLLNRSPLARGPKPSRPLDLHTLGTPQAFVLSQDQTLQRKVASSPTGLPRSSPNVVWWPLLTAKLSRLSPLFSFQGSPLEEATSGHPPRTTPVAYQMVRDVSILFQTIV
jgi:hypothetical protein